MSDRTSSMILIMLAVAVILGAVMGHLAPQAMQDAGFIGRLSLDFLFVLVIPLVVASIVVASATGKRSFPQGKVLGNAFAIFASLTLVAIVIALALGMIFQPGAGVDLAGESLPDYMSPQRSPGVPMLLERIVPSSFAQLFTPDHLLGLILFSLFFGLTLRRLGRRARAINDLMRGLRDALQRLVGAYLWVLPVGLVFLVGAATAEEGFSERLIAKMGTFTLALVIGLVVQGAIVLPLVAAFVGRSNPWYLFRDMLPALATALGTGSATATLPVTQRYAMDEAGIERNTGSLVLPLGTLLNVCGTAMFVALGALFVMQTANVGISVVSMLLITAVALLVPVGLVGVPRGALLVLMIALQVVDLPLAGYVGLGLLAAFAWFFERLQTVVDVWADVVAAATVAHLTGTEHQVPRSRDRGKPQEERGDRGRRERPERDRQKESRSQSREDRPGRSRGRRDDRRESRRDDRRDSRRDDRRGRGSGPRQERQEPRSKSPFSIPMSERRKDHLDIRTSQSADATGGDKGAPSRPSTDNRQQGDDSRGRSRGRSDSRSESRPDRRRGERRSQESRDSGSSNGRSTRDEDRRQGRDRRRGDNQNNRRDRQAESTRAVGKKSEPKPQPKPEPKTEARKIDKRPSESPEPATARGKGRLADLTDEAIERERARVNAQLAAMRTMLDDRQESTPADEAAIESEKQGGDERLESSSNEQAKRETSEQRIEAPEPAADGDDVQVDYAESGDEHRTTAEEGDGEATASQQSDMSESEPEQPREASYGRSRSRRGAGRRERVETAPEPSEPESEQIAPQLADADEQRPPDDSLASRLAVKIAQSADESGDSEPVDEPETETDETEEPQQADDQLSFGRKPSRRGKGPRRRQPGSAADLEESDETPPGRNEESEEDEPDSDEVAETIGSSFEVNNQSFGRGKRRK